MYTVSLFKKTCRDHCQIFLHHSPQEGNLRIEFDTLVENLAADICVCCDDDLHFRLAFPWYSYSPTLKFRQLDISSDEEWNKGQNLFVSFPAVDNQGRGGWRGALSHTQGRLELCLTALQSTAAREPPDSTTHNSPDDSLSKTTKVLFNLKWSATDTLLNWKTVK